MRPNTIQRFYGYFLVDHDHRVVLGAEASRLDFERSRGYRLSADPLEGDLVDLLDPTPGRYGPREMVGVSPTFIRQWAVFLEDSLPVGDRFRLTGVMRFDGMSLDRQNLSPPRLIGDWSTSSSRRQSWSYALVIDSTHVIEGYRNIRSVQDRLHALESTGLAKRESVR